MVEQLEQRYIRWWSSWSRGTSDGVTVGAEVHPMVEQLEQRYI
jgi:hypothetical protein